MNGLDYLKQIADHPNEYARGLIASGKKIIGNFCSYTPEEIIHAAGAVPFRIFGTEGDISLADAHLQSYSCSLVRGALEEALKGDLDFLHGTVFPHTCDSIQRLSDTWRLNTDFDSHFDVVLPVKLNTESARSYMEDVFSRFRNDIEQNLGVVIDDTALHGAINLYHDNRSLLDQLYRLRAKDPSIMSGNDLYAVMKASMIMDRDELNGNLKSLVLKLKNRSGQAGHNKNKRVLLSGGICSHPDIYSVLERAGGDVVWDDLCTGTRYFTGRTAPDIGPVNALANFYMERIICPAKHSSPLARGENLLKLVREHAIDGVVFLFLKFCDPHSFDYPYLKQYLDNAGVPSLLLEVEEQLPGEAQLLTRFESFIEMLS